MWKCRSCGMFLCRSHWRSRGFDTCLEFHNISNDTVFGCFVNGFDPNRQFPKGKILDAAAEAVVDPVVEPETESEEEVDDAVIEDILRETAQREAV